MESKAKKYEKNLIQIFTLLIVVISFLILKPLLIPILVGLILAYLFYPFHKFLINRVFKSKQEYIKSISALITTFTIVLVVLTPALTLILSLLSNIRHIYAFILELTPKVSHAITESLPGFIGRLNESLGITIDLTSIITNFAGKTLQTAQGLVTQIPSFLLGSLIVLFVVYYLLKHYQEAFQWLQKILPLPKSQYRLIQARFDNLGRGMITSQIAIAITQGLLLMLAFYILGFENFLLIGLLATVLAIIPFMGAIFVWLPLSIFMFLDLSAGAMLWKPLFLFFYGLLIVSSVDNVIRPKLMSNAAQINPAIVLVGFIGGLFLFGLPGILIGPLTLALVDLSIDIYKNSL